MPISFGTDGWRAVISEEFTFDNVRKVAQAIADELLTDHPAAETPPGSPPGSPPESGQRPAMVIGFDTRFLSDRYAIAVAEVLAANNIFVWLAQSDAPHQ